MSTFSIDEALRHRCKVMERVQQIKDDLSEKSRKRVYKHVYILDLKGLGVKHLKKKNRGPMKALLDLGQHHFPETLDRMFLLCTPALFRGLWKIMSVWVDPVTKAKIQLLPKKYLPRIEAAGMPRSQLPDWMGGSHPNIA